MRILRISGFAVRIEQQRETVGVMEIRLFLWMNERPIGESAALLFNDGAQTQAYLSYFRKRRQVVQIDERIQFEPMGVAMQGNLRGLDIFNGRHPFSITLEAIDCPFRRRGEVEFAISRRP